MIETWLALVSFAAAAVSFTLALFAWVSWVIPATAAARATSAAARAFAFFVLAVAVWSAGAGFEYLAPTLAARVFWAKLEHVGVAAIGLAWFAFGLSYVGALRRLRHLWPLALIPALSLALVFTNEQHHLIWTAVTWREGGVGAAFAHGWWFSAIYAPYTYLLAISGSLVLLRRGLRAAPADRRALVALALTPFPAMLYNLPYLLRAWPLADVTPVAFALGAAMAGVVLVWRQLLRRDLIDARVLLEQLSDALVVLSASGKLLEANVAARRCWRDPDLADMIRNALPSLHLLPPGGSYRRWLEHAGSRYEVAAQVLPTSSGGEPCYLVSLRDVSAQAEAAARLERYAAERDLLANVKRLLLESDTMAAFLPRLGELLLGAPELGVDQLAFYWRRPGGDLDVSVCARDPRRGAAVREALSGLLHAGDQEATGPTSAAKGPASALHACLETGEPHYLEDVELEPDRTGLLWARREADPSRTVLLCPLLRQGEVEGVLEFAADAPHAFDEARRALFGQIARNAELALERQHERERLELEVARMNAVVATGERMRHLDSRQAVSEVAVAAVLERTQATMATLLWYCEASADAPERLQAVASRRADSAPSFAGSSIARGEGLAWAAFDGGATVRANGPELLAHVITCDGSPVYDYIASPLLGPDNLPIGVLVASLERTHGFEERDVAFLEAIAQATSSALTRLALLEAAAAEAEAYESLYRTSLRQAQELELLDRVRTAVARELELDEVIRTLVTAISETFGYAQVSLYWLEGERLVPRYYVGYEQVIPSLDLRRGVMARAIRSGAPVLVEDVTQDPDFVAGAPGTTSEIAVPIRGRGQLVGVLNVETSEGMRLDEADLKLMTSLGEQVGLAVERALWHAEVQRSEERFRLLAETVSDLVCLHGPEGELRYVSPSSAVLLGTPAEALMGQPLTTVVHPDDWQGLKRRMVGLLRTGAAPDPFVLRLRRMDGSYGTFETVIQPLLNEGGELQGFTSSSRDVTERQRMEERLRYAAHYDALTGLANRARFLERLEAALVKGRALAVLFVDLDRFKMVNDSLGHEVGDALLKMISARLRAQVRQGDTVARLGGDEFCVLLERLESETEAVRISERLLAALAEPFALAGREVFVGASIGIAYGEPGAVRADELLRNADIAMYRAKHGGRGGYVVFDHAMHQEVLSRLTLETDLRRALERGEFSLVYQPIFALESGELAGFEALCRWQRNGVPVPPDQFITLAEETGLITELDAWVLETASAQLAAWRRSGADWGVSVNLASRSFEQPDLPERVQRVLRATVLPPHALTLELTERTVMDRGGGAKLSALRALGVRVEVDDFGTGYSSLRYLHELPLDSLKIDRSFVAQLGSDQPGAVVRSILALADQLGLDVVAEGIETEAQLERLRALGCAFGQGYLLARPLPPAEVERRFLSPACPGPLELALYASGDQLASGD